MNSSNQLPDAFFLLYSFKASKISRLQVHVKKGTKCNEFVVQSVRFYSIFCQAVPRTEERLSGCEHANGSYCQASICGNCQRE